MQIDPRRAVAYWRVSDPKQDISPEAQAEALGRYAASQGYELIATYGETISGGAQLEDRAALLEALDACKRFGAGILLVYRRDRLARGDAVLTAMIERMAQRHGARIVSTELGDREGPEVELMGRILDAFAQYERAMIRSRTKAALAHKRSRGEKLGGKCPYGYRAEDGMLFEVPQEKVILDRIKALAATGASYRGIARTLNAGGIPARGKCWYPASIRRMLSA